MPDTFIRRPGAVPRRPAAAVAAVLVALGLALAALAAAPASADAAKVLKKGSRGPAVAQVQRALGIAADGVFGPKTRRAVKRFQRRHGLTADGIVGPATRAALGLGKKKTRPKARKQSLTPRQILRRIAQCESGGNPRAVSPDGRYRGKYQFHRATWRSLGGKGDPAKASEAEQDRLARLLYDREGTRPWPTCGKGL